MTVPVGTPALTCTLKVTMPVPPAVSVPPLDGSEGGVWPEETTPMPLARGDTPAPGSGTATPFITVELATYPALAGTVSVSTTPVAGVAPELVRVMVYWSTSPGSTLPLLLLSTTSWTVLSAEINGRLPTMTVVGSFSTGVAGLSDGCSGKGPLPRPEPFTKPWLEMMVPFTTLVLIFTSNVIVATLAVAAPASAGIAPAVGSAGELIDKPLCSAVTLVPGSATTTPFSLVLLAT